MNIFLTGATGFIGKHLVKELLEKGYNIFCTLQKGERNPFSNYVKTIIVEHENLNDVINFFIDNKINGIIHLASVFLSSHTYNDISILIDSNIKFSTMVLECAAKAKVKWFINTGTFWQHYNNESYNPVNLYAATKQAFEDIAKYYIKTSDLKFVTIKLNDTFGPNDARPKIFNLWNKIAESGETLDMSPGEQVIDINYIDNVVIAYVRLIEILENDEDNIKYKSFALYSNRRLTLRELAKLYEEITNKKLNINWGGKPYRDREVMIPWEKGEKIPGYIEKTSLENGIKKLVLNKCKGNET